MRFVDLAVAALIGTSALTGFIAWNPGQGDAAAREAALRSQLRDSLLDKLQQKGTPWILQSPRPAVCSYFADMSNSSSGVYVTLGSTTCGAEPAPGAVTATISMSLLPFEVTLEAWSVAKA